MRRVLRLGAVLLYCVAPVAAGRRCLIHDADRIERMNVLVAY